MDGTFFATTYAGVVGPMDAFVAGAIAALSAYLLPVMRLAAVLYIGGMALIAALNPSQEPLTAMIRNVVRVALVLFIVSSVANYQQYFGTIFLNTLPTELSNAISGPAGGTSLANGGAFDQVFNRAWAAGLIVYKNLPWSIKGIALEMMVGLYWLLAILAVGIGFVIYLSCHVMLALVVALGPLFVCCFLFPMTRRFFDGWISAMVSLVLTQLLSVTLLSMLMQVETTTLSQIAANDAGANVINQMRILIYGIAVLILCAVLAYQLAGIATAIAGGVHHQIGVYSSAVYNVVGSAASGIAGGTAAAAGRATSAAASVGSTTARTFVSRPPGQSLSSFGSYRHF